MMTVGMKQILVVDDDRDILDSVALVLREAYAVSTALGGAAALKCLEAGTYDLILLDLMMPEEDGLFVIDEIAKRAIDTPVLLMSASQHLGLHAVDLKVAGTISKPFRVEALQRRIGSVLRRKGSRTRPREDRERQKGVRS